MKLKTFQFLFILFFVFLSIEGFTQHIGGNPGGKIFGKIIDAASRLPIEFATVSIFKKGEWQPILGVTTDSSGKFYLNGLKNDLIYQIHIEFLGYKLKIVDNISLNLLSPFVNLKTISLLSSSKILNGLTVTAQKELIENRIDKVVYNAEKDVTSQGGVATDLLQKIPQISVDVDGNVELAGSSSIRFLINGKPSSAFGSNVADVLQAIPASEIKSIEVITNPSAKYDGQGLGGIINIILKQNSAQGINGNLALTAGTRNENGSFNLNIRKNQFGLNAFVSIHDRLPAISQNKSDQYKIIDSGRNQTHLHQQGPSKIGRKGLQSGIGFDWALSKKSNLSGGINFNVFARENSAQTEQLSITSPINSLIDTLNRVSNFDKSINFSNFKTFEASLDWKKKFNKPNQELEIAVNTSLGHGESKAQNMLFMSPYKVAENPYFGDSTQNPGHDNETEFSVDYTQELKKNVLLGFGGKINLRDVRNDIFSNQLDTLLQSYKPNVELSNQILYKQQIYAIYTELAFPIGDLFDVKLGIRYQRTALKTYFSNAPAQASPPGYNSYLPSLFFSKKLGINKLIKFNYSRRIEPPQYNDLNPYVNITDPNNFLRGNPYLLPEISDRFEFAYNISYDKIGSFALTLFYRTSNHDIQPYAVLYPKFTVGSITYNNITVSTRENIGLEEDAGFNLFSDIHLNNRFDVRTNATLFKRYTTNELDKGLNAQSFNYRINVNLNYSFSKDIVAEFSGSFNSARNQVQGRYPSFTSYNLALRKQFSKGNTSIGIVAGNFLSKYVSQPLSIKGINFTAKSDREIPYRTFGLNFTWKFGSLKFKKDKEDKSSTVEFSPD